MVKEILLVHPLGQAAAFFFGMFNLVTGFTRRCFIIIVHINFGVMFYALTCIGSGIGVLTAWWAARNEIIMPVLLHGVVAGLCMFLLVFGAVSGFLLQFKKADRARMIVMHRCSNAALMALFVLQAVTGLRAVLSVYS